MIIRPMFLSTGAQMLSLRSRHIVFAALIACLSCALPCSAQIKIMPRAMLDSLVKAQSSPREWSSAFLAFDSLVADAGRVAEDAAPIEATFTFRNLSGEAIKFGQPQTSCSCADATVVPAFVPADSSAVVKLRYRQKGHSGVHPRYVYLRLAEPVDTVVAVVSLRSCVY